ncbi:MAG: DoxX family protein [Gammaproteobacteria bacterium]|nr:DoxX family protein [Gammaproteobacteria bacterium]
MRNIELLIGRILLAHIFILAGLGKIGAYAATQGYMDTMGVPGALLPAVITLQVGGGIALAAGLFTRYTAWALAAFCVISAIIFHNNFADQAQMILFMKNLAMSGGLMVIAAASAGSISIDHWRLQSVQGGNHAYHQGT